MGVWLTVEQPPPLTCTSLLLIPPCAWVRTRVEKHSGSFHFVVVELSAPPPSPSLILKAVRILITVSIHQPGPSYAPFAYEP